VAHGVFEGGLPWAMIFVGMGVAVGIIAVDLWLERRKSDFRMPVLAVAIGIYLPFQLSSSIFIGGLVAWAVQRSLRRRREVAASAASDEELMKEVEQRGLLLASGFITGEALVGILLAIPIVVAKRSDALAFWGVHEEAWPGLLLLALVVYGLYRLGAPRSVSE